MLSEFYNGSKFKISKESKDRIESEIEKLSSLADGIYSKIKVFDLGYYIKIMIDKAKITIPQDKYLDIPDFITFLIILDYSYPEQPPKIISKTKVKLIL